MYQTNATQVVSFAKWNDVVLRTITNVVTNWVNGNNSTKLPIVIITFNMVKYFMYKTPVQPNDLYK